MAIGTTTYGYDSPLAVRGTLRYLGTMGRIQGTVRTTVQAGSIEAVGSIGYVRRMGTLAQMGTLRYLVAGSLGRVGYTGRVGTVGYIERTGTINKRAHGSQTVWTTRHTAVGSAYIGSYYDMTGFFTKTALVRSSMNGTFALLTTMTGTATAGRTGTYYRSRIGAGSMLSISLQESLRYLRPFARMGSFGSGKGTLSVMLLYQA